MPAVRKTSKGLPEFLTGPFCRFAAFGLNAPVWQGGKRKETRNIYYDACYFAVATCGRVAHAQNIITQIRHYLKRKGIQLHYGEGPDIYSSCVIGYEMRETVMEEAQLFAADLKPTIECIIASNVCQLRDHQLLDEWKV